MRAEDIMNGYLGSSLLLSTTTVVSGEGKAAEISVKKSVIISLRTTYIALPTKLLSQVIQ